MSLYTDQDGLVQGSVPGNVLSLGKNARDPVVLGSPNGVSLSGTVTINGVLLLGANAQSLVSAAGSSAATNTTVTVAGTGATLLADSKVNGTLGTVAYTFNDLVRALKVAGVIAQ